MIEISVEWPKLSNLHGFCSTHSFNTFLLYTELWSYIDKASLTNAVGKVAIFTFSGYTLDFLK